MKRALLYILTFLLFTSTALAQRNFIKGLITDTASSAKLQNATIVILNAKDSTLYRFVRAGQDGSFSFQGIKNGNFILLVSYPKYADFVNHFSVDSIRKSIDFKIIDMKSKVKLLNEVIIKGKVTAIKIKGDTTEFNAAAYNIKPNDRVEDLIKQFPGIQVDAQGKITAQGKAVEKVLVDGEEFFGDDPTLVTKNLRADMVDKVQLFEKSSDQAAFTGVDDGQKKQTLNIVLKEDKKRGYFGKVDVGYGTDDFYQAQAMFNKFKKKEKIAAYATGSNTGKTGLGWDDAGKYGAGQNMEMSDDGSFWFMSGGDDMDSGSGRYWGEGIPVARTGGIHYENKWDNDKHSLNTNYKIGLLNVKINKNTLRQNNLPTGIINSNTDENTENDTFRQKIDATYNIKLDTTSNLKVTIDGTLKNTESLNASNATSRREDNSLLNNADRTTTNKGKQQLFNLNALYMKKLKKQGRNYSINLIQAYSKNANDGYLKSDNNFYDENGILTDNEKIDQWRDNEVTSNRLSTNLTYNEPFTRFFSLIANYGLTFMSNDAHKRTYDASSPNNYNSLNADFSNHFQADQLTNQLGAIFSYKKGKTIVSFGTKTNFINFDQKELYTHQKFNRSFTNWLPQASYQYKFSAQKSFNFYYNGSTNQPSVDQLQPVKTNDDPLNIPEGNPWLVPSFNNRFNVRYNTYKVLSEQSFYVSGSINFTQNQIVSNNTTDDKGITTYKSVNLTSQTPFNYYAYTGISRKVKFLGKINTGLSLNLNGSTQYNYVNNSLNQTNTTSIGPSVNLNKYQDKGSFYLQFGPTYTIQEASLQKQLNNNGWGYNGWFDVNYKLPLKFSVQSNAEYTYQPSSSSFANSFEQLIINASVTKAFFKEEKLKLMLSANDLLNQNKGFRRFASANSITQTSYNNINRYFMFSLIWDFNKMGGVPKTN